MRTLLSKQEAVIRSELGAKFPQCELSDILQTEEWEFRNCLGWDLYEDMLSALVDYCNVNAWSSQNYTIGAMVKNAGLIWISKRGGTNTEPLIENEYWSLAPKFDSTAACKCDLTVLVLCGVLYNEIWCRYLARYLSLKVAKLTIPRVAVVATGNGVVRATANGMIPADKNEIQYLVQGIETQSIQVFDNMMAWIKRTNRIDCFGEFDALCKPVTKCADNAISGCESARPYTVGVSVY